MNKNLRIAKELIKIAKNLMAGSYYDEMKKNKDVTKEYSVKATQDDKNVNIQITINGGLSEELKSDTCFYILNVLKSPPFHIPSEYHDNIINFSIPKLRLSNEKNILDVLKNFGIIDPLEKYDFKLTNQTELKNQTVDLIKKEYSIQVTKNDDNNIDIHIKIEGDLSKEEKSHLCTDIINLTNLRNTIFAIGHEGDAVKITVPIYQFSITNVSDALKLLEEIGIKDWLKNNNFTLKE